ncbi:MAG: DUF488 family protein [Eubacteriaceae bacterium]|nr:DUF488 family protein [Eubacteriaceae bacterium]
MVLKLKRIYESRSSDDGYRVLVDRLWPRGIKKVDAHIDLWAKELAPSTALRKKFHNGVIDYKAFKEVYGGELAQNVELIRFVRLIEKKEQEVVTLLTAVKDVDHSHIPVLMSKMATLLERES